MVELPQEYSRECKLREIVRAVETLIDLDAPARNRDFGYYARILVDVVLSRHAFDERRPLFCNHFYVIGHNITTWKWLHPEATTKVPDRGKRLVVDEPSTQTVPHRHQWIPIRDTGVSTSSHLSAPNIPAAASLHTQEQPTQQLRSPIPTVVVAHS